jgi:peptidoglycan LD-endopeptidase CwlK
MDWQLTAKALAHLVGVHPDLVRVIKRAAQASPLAFTITDGVRTLAEQQALKAAGASRTLNSRHLPTPAKDVPTPVAHAVDLAVIVDGKIRWDWPLYRQLATIVKAAAAAEAVAIRWGGDWKRFPDGPHFELDRAVYP